MLFDARQTTTSVGLHGVYAHLVDDLGIKVYLKNEQFASTEYLMGCYVEDLGFSPRMFAYGVIRLVRGKRAVLRPCIWQEHFDGTLCDDYARHLAYRLDPKLNDEEAFNIGIAMPEFIPVASQIENIIHCFESRGVGCLDHRDKLDNFILLANGDVKAFDFSMDAKYCQPNLYRTLHDNFAERLEITLPPKTYLDKLQQHPILQYP